MNENLNPLALVVTKNVAGVLETNIEQLEVYVNSKLDEYKPELYQGNADAAKKDRAELNNSKKALSQARISLMKELMKPYSDFENRCKLLEKKIDSASDLLDEIVKAKEELERQEKLSFVNDIWESKQFDLVPLEKVFNPKWLNKTAKEKDISEEMDSRIKKIYSDLKIIELNSKDTETLKAHYLISLDLDETLTYGSQLEETRLAAENEAKCRTEREHNERMSEQRREVALEALDAMKDKELDRAVSEILGEPTKPEIREYVVSVKATEEQLLKLKSACNALGIEYSVEELEF